MRLQKKCRRVLTAWLLLAGSAQAATLSGFVTDADNGEALTRVIVAVEGLQLRAISNNSGYYAVVQVPAGTHRSECVARGLPEPVGTRCALARTRPCGSIWRWCPSRWTWASRFRWLASTSASASSRCSSCPPSARPTFCVAYSYCRVSKRLRISAAACTCAAATPARRATLLDQTPLYNPSHLFGLFSTFNPDAIKKVDLYKGAYPAPYGRTLGAVLDVRNREGNRKRTSGRGGVSPNFRPLAHRGTPSAKARGCWPAAARKLGRRIQRPPRQRGGHPLELLLLRSQRQHQPTAGRRHLRRDHILGPRRLAD